MTEKPKTPRSSFFAGLSHRVRQPLNGVVEQLHALLEEPVSAGQRRLLENVRDAGRDLATLVNDILDFTRLTEGNFVLDEQSFDLPELLTGLEQEIAPRFRARGLRFELLVHPDVPVVINGDAGRLRQALANFVLAGPWASDDRRLVLEVTPEEETANSVRLRFVFRAGVSDRSLVLWRRLLAAARDAAVADVVLAEYATGRALRLMVAARLFAVMGGGVTVPDNGGGQRAIEAAATLGRYVPLSESDAADVSLLSGLRVLLVDGDAESAARLADPMHAWGCRVERIAHADDAVASLQDAHEHGEPMHVALLVNRANGQEAEDAGRAIKNDLWLRQTAVGLITDIGRRGDAARLREIGFSLYLTQPVTAAQLRDALSMVADEFHAAGAHPGSGIITRHLLRERQWRTLNVGVLENSSVHRMVVRLLLEKLGCQTFEIGEDDAGAGPALDIVLAGPDAPKTVLAQLKEAKPSPWLVAMLDAADMEKTDNDLAVWFDDFVAAPLTIHGLRDLLTTALERREIGDGETGEAARPPALDLAQLLAAFDDDREVVLEVTAFFVEDFAGNLARLKEVVGAGDAATAERLAETMKDAAGSLELARLQHVMADIQQLAATADLAGVGRFLSKAERLFEQLREAFGMI